MTLQRLALAFFKHNQINRVIHRDIIKFPCLDCNMEAKMYAPSTCWSCEFCGATGNISHLEKKLKDKDLKQMRKLKLYDPKKEQWQLNSDFNYLMEKASDKELVAHVEKMKARFRELTLYYQRLQNEKER